MLKEKYDKLMEKFEEIQLEIQSLTPAPISQNCSMNEAYCDKESGELILYELCINLPKKAKQKLYLLMKNKLSNKIIYIEF